jgi:hypothetical protein
MRLLLCVIFLPFFGFTLHQRRGLGAYCLFAAPFHPHNPAELLFAEDIRSYLAGLMVRRKYVCVMGLYLV